MSQARQWPGLRWTFPMALAPASVLPGLPATIPSARADGPVDAATFAALMGGGGAVAPLRGRLATGLQLAELALAEVAVAREDGTGPAQPGLATGVSLPGGAKTEGLTAPTNDTPDILPAEPDKGTSPPAPDVLPGGPVPLTPGGPPSTEIEVALSGPGAGTGKGTDSLALAQALSALNAEEGVEAATETVRRAVNTAPTIQPLEGNEAPPTLELEAEAEGATPLVPARAAGSPATAAGAPVEALRPASEARAERSVTETLAAAIEPVEGPPGLPSEGEDTGAGLSRAEGPTRVDLSPTVRGGPDAVAQIAAQILRRLEGRTTRFDMQLTPAELGRVDVRLDIDAEGRLAARLAFDNPAAAADLRGRVDELRRELADAGFDVGADAFSFEERSSGDDRAWAHEPRLAADRFGQAAEAADLADLSTLRAVVRDGLDLRI